MKRLKKNRFRKRCYIDSEWKKMICKSIHDIKWNICLTFVTVFFYLAELQARIKKCNEQVFTELESKMPNCKTELKNYHQTPTTLNWNQIQFKCNSMNELGDLSVFDIKFQRLMGYSGENDNSYPLPNTGSNGNNLVMSFSLLIVTFAAFI